MSSAEKKNRPDNSQFRQQRMPAWQPVMSPPHVAIFLAVLGVAFIPIGGAIIASGNDTQNIEIRYDQINTCTNTHNQAVFNYTVPGSDAWFAAGCNTLVNFTLDSDIAGPVYMYYKLTNFYQNHRRFAKSRDLRQLAALSESLSSMTSCTPLQSPGQLDGMTGHTLSVDGQNMTYGDLSYSPCGLVAWSMFNDSFRLLRYDSSGNATLMCDTAYFSRLTNEPLVNQSCTKSGITWDSDFQKFKSPLIGSSVWTGSRSDLGLPTLNTTDGYLANGWYANEPGHALPLATDEDFMVWMRTASLPTFRKLLRVFPDGLQAGNYTMQITELYDSQQYGGSKSFAISTVSWVGGKNGFLGLAYVIVGAVAVVAAIAFFIIHKINGDRSEAAVSILSGLRG